MKTISLALLAAIMMLSGPREDLLVSTSWLASHLEDRDLVLLHVGEKAEYDVMHLPGARFISMQDVSAPRTGDPNQPVLELPDAGTLRARLEQLGITDRSRIIVYNANDVVTQATRLIFTLDWIGLGDRTSLLDGGMQTWKREGRSLTADIPAPRAGKLSAKPVKNLVVDAQWVNANRVKAGYRLIDARVPAFYAGVQMGKKAGHIPGATNFPYTTVTNDSLRWESADDLRQRFAAAGVKPGDTIVAYCHIGQQATAIVFAARTLGYNVLMYDGSFREWETLDLPVENPSAVGKPR